MIYALINKDGSYVIRYGLDGHEDEIKDLKIHKLDREPRLGEIVCTKTGRITTDFDSIKNELIQLIKAEASRRILEAVPLFRQLNDIRNPNEEGVIKRNQEIDNIRKWSNELEKQLVNAKTIETIALVKAEIGE